MLALDGGPKEQSWSRYVFPAEIDYWTIDGVDLLLRAGTLEWRVSEDALEDDVREEPTGIVCVGDLWSSDNGCQVSIPPVILADGVYTFDSAG